MSSILSRVPPGPQRLTINYVKHSVNAVIKVFLIDDGKFKIAYAPAMDMSGYGNTYDEAKDMLKESLEDYFDTILDMNHEQKASEELAKYGWTKAKWFKKRYENESYIDKDGILKNFNLPKETKIEESVMEMV